MKKLTVILLALSMISGTSVYAAQPLNENDEQVTAAASAGVLEGTDEGYELERNVTRAEALVFISRLTGLNGAGNNTPFEDVKGHWAEAVIAAFYAAGYIDGTSETGFEPDRAVMAKEFMKILLSASGESGVTLENAYERAVSFGLLVDDAVQELVMNNEVLSRSDTVRLCYDYMSRRTHTPDLTEKLLSFMPEDKSYMISPYSIKTAFAMAANGMVGETREQLLEVLGIKDIEAYNEEIKEMMGRYANDKVITFNTANSTWIFRDNTDSGFTDSYKNILTESYKAEAYEVTNDEAVEKINGWVSDKTEKRIDSILDEKSFEAMQDELLAMLINAVYFKAAWQNQFNAALTEKDIFTGADGTEYELDFMHNSGSYRYFDSGDMQIIELPYSRRNDEGETSGHNISMYAAKGDYDYHKAVSAIDKLDIKNVRLSFPKFRTKYETGLTEIFRELGAVDMLDPEKADMSAMFDNEDAYISSAIHKTYIDVDENGTEAAAVTAISVGTTSAPIEIIDVDYNTPFMYLIRDNDTGEIIFAGEFKGEEQ